MAGGPERAREARGRAGQAKRGDHERASRSALGPRREGVRVRHPGWQEDPGRALRRALTAARLQHHVRPRLHARRLPRLYQPGRRARRHARSPEPSRRDPSLFFAGAGGAADAYKQRMGWQFPYVSTYNSNFAFDFGLALTEEQAQQVPEVKEMIDNPPEFLKKWSRQIGAELKDGLRENPSWIAFARENGTVYHTYTVSAPDPFVAPYFSFLLERTPKAQPDIAGTLRKDEYPD